MLRPGVLLGNRYRLDERIAGGGMGDVWRGTDEVLGRTVAVKILLPALLDEPGFAERFRAEARTMATINHPGVVDVYDYGNDEQVAFLVMEYVEGDALSRTLNRVKRLTPARTMALMAQAADALQAAHSKGIVHRDVKPGNLLVRPNGTLVLTDFGIARSEMAAQLTVAGSVLGTASYISPEQAAGATATSASDLYALGVVAYQCLSGHRPFEGDNPLEIAMKHVRDLPRPLPGDIPPAVRAIVERSMAKDPSARWPSAATLASVARQAAATLSATSHQGAARPRSVPPAPTSGGSGTPVPGPPAGPRPPHLAPPSQAPVVHPVQASQPPRPQVTQPPRPPAGTAPISGATPPAGPTAARINPAHPGAVPQPPSRPAQGFPSPVAQPQQPATRQYGGFVAPGPGYPSPQPPAASQEQNRNGLIAVVVVVGLLALLACAGVIGYLARQGAA